MHNLGGHDGRGTRPRWPSIASSSGWRTPSSATATRHGGGRPGLRAGARRRRGSTSCPTAAISAPTRTRSRRAEARTRLALARRAGAAVPGRGARLQGHRRPGGGVPRAAGPGARLLIAGRPRGGASTTRLAAAAAADRRIRLPLRFVPDDELQVWLRAADVVVLPFRDILTSGSAILALSFGRPVVAPALGCLPETVPTAGVLYDPDAPMRRDARCRRTWCHGAAARARPRTGLGTIAASTAACTAADAGSPVGPRRSRRVGARVATSGVEAPPAGRTCHVAGSPTAGRIRRRAPPPGSTRAWTTSPAPRPGRGRRGRATAADAPRPRATRRPRRPRHP